jgi:hypothetical protein
MRGPAPPPHVSPARVRTVLLIFAVVALGGWGVLDAWTGAGRDPLPLPWTAILGTAVLALAVISIGLPVRRWVRGDRDQPLDPLFAARAVVLAKAAAYGGAALAGWYVAQGLDLMPDIVGARRTKLALALLAAVAAAAVTVAGFVVQRWCRVPPSDDDDDSRTEG